MREMTWNRRQETWPINVNSIHFSVWDLEYLLEFFVEMPIPKSAWSFMPSAIVSSENETIIVLERL